MARKSHQYHYIYKTTCIVTNKFYVGMHSTRKMDDGYLGSGKKLRYSIRKYGKENHTIEYLEFLSDRSSLIEREIDLISDEMLNDPLCMNISNGGVGGGGFIDAEHKRKVHEGASKFLKRKWEEDDYREKMKVASSEKMKRHHQEGKIKYNTFTGKQHSEESIQKMCKPKNQGEKNSQFGTCWITKDGTNKKIKKVELEYYISSGWVAGRK
jgi:hypothetical protein